MDERNLAGFTYMGMAVDIIGSAVGSPPRVTNTNNAFGGIGLQLIFKILNFSFPFLDVQLAIQQRNTRRIVAAILQPLQPFDNNIARLLISYISYYSAHICKWLRICLVILILSLLVNF